MKHSRELGKQEGLEVLTKYNNAWYFGSLLGHVWMFFSKNKTPSISYKTLQLRMLYTNPRRDLIVTSYVEAH